MSTTKMRLPASARCLATAGIASQQGLDPGAECRVITLRGRAVGDGDAVIRGRLVVHCYCADRQRLRRVVLAGLLLPLHIGAHLAWPAFSQSWAVGARRLTSNETVPSLFSRSLSLRPSRSGPARGAMNFFALPMAMPSTVGPASISAIAQAWGSRLKGPRL